MAIAATSSYDQSLANTGRRTQRERSSSSSWRAHENSVPSICSVYIRKVTAEQCMEHRSCGNDGVSNRYSCYRRHTSACHNSSTRGGAEYDNIFLESRMLSETNVARRDQASMQATTTCEPGRGSGQVCIQDRKTDGSTSIHRFHLLVSHRLLCLDILLWSSSYLT